MHAGLLHTAEPGLLLSVGARAAGSLRPPAAACRHPERLGHPGPARSCSALSDTCRRGSCLGPDGGARRQLARRAGEKKDPPALQPCAPPSPRSWQGCAAASGTSHAAAAGGGAASGPSRQRRQRRRAPAERHAGSQPRQPGRAAAGCALWAGRVLNLSGRIGLINQHAALGAHLCPPPCYFDQLQSPGVRFALWAGGEKMDDTGAWGTEASQSGPNSIRNRALQADDAATQGEDACRVR